MIFPVPPPKPLIHPTLDQIERREREILMWDLEHRQRQQWLCEFYAAKRSRMAAHAVLVSCAFTACMMFGFFGYPIPALISLVLVAALGAMAIRERNTIPSVSFFGEETKRPERIAVVEYSKWENDYFISRQHEEKFTARCICPGCGNIDTHLISDNERKVPWGSINRQCRTCRREWVQS